MSVRHVVAVAMLSSVLLPVLVQQTQAQQTPADMAGRADTAVSPPIFRWQRIITPPKGDPHSEACVVLDADVFANAAPSLRDVRLYQDGEELPYVVEQSFDERALDTGVTPEDDRSLYETVAAGTMHATASHTGVPAWVATMLVPQRVPVERVQVQPTPADALLFIRATDTVPSLLGGGAETAQGFLSLAHPAFAFTLGANLQAPAQVDVTLTGRSLQAGKVLLQMRRRSLCYQPASASPLVLYLGGGDIPAASYSFAHGFQSEADRPTATMGALLPNPEFHPAATIRWQLPKPVRVGIAIAAFALLLVFNARRLFRKTKVPAA